jgi:hypothetical protein
MSYSESEAEIRYMLDNYIGICTQCGDHREMVEPDAEGYKCESCGQMAVMGAENAIMMDILTVEEE